MLNLKFSKTTELNTLYNTEYFRDVIEIIYCAHTQIRREVFNLWSTDPRFCRTEGAVAGCQGSTSRLRKIIEVTCYKGVQGKFMLPPLSKHVSERKYFSRASMMFQLLAFFWQVKPRQKPLQALL